MLIYISGKITGLDYADVEAKFQDAQDLLSDIGFEVVNPLNNGLTKEHSWEQHMVKDFELLLPCDAIYMMDNWQDSTGARIEYRTAFEMNKDVWFESNIVSLEKMVLRIQNAVHEATGMKFNEYTTKSRKRDGFFARMLFVYHCRRNRMKLVEIAKYVHRDHSSMLHLLKKYDDEKKFNPNFRVLAEKVESILNKTINGKA